MKRRVTEKKLKTVKVSERLWLFLNSHRLSSSDTKEDVIWRFIVDAEYNPNECKGVKKHAKTKRKKLLG